MLIKKKEKLSIPGGMYNENIANTVSNAAWIMDGTNGLDSKVITSKESDAIWYVEMLDRYILEHISNKKICLAEIILQGITFMEEEYKGFSDNQNIEEINQPSAGIALVRWNKDELEYFVMGDCQVWLKDYKNIKVISDFRVTSLNEKVTKALKENISKGASHKEALKNVEDLILENKKKCNKINGYWGLNFNKTAVYHGVSGKLKYGKEHNFLEILLVSKGLYAICECYKKLCEIEVFTYVKSKGLDELGQYIRSIEEEDSNIRKYARLEKSSDVSAVYINFEKSSFKTDISNNTVIKKKRFML